MVEIEDLQNLIDLFLKTLKKSLGWENEQWVKYIDGILFIK